MSQASRSRLVTPHANTLVIGVGIATMALLGTVPAVAAPTSPEGIWYTKDNESIIKVQPCKTAYCGMIVWLKEPTDKNGSPKLDNLNTDPEKKDKPIIGLDILINMVAVEDHWKGKAYNPDDGKFYDITFKVKTDKEPNDQADLRGCILGFLCQTETFNRASDVPGGDPTLSASGATPGAKPQKGAHPPKKDTAHK